MCVYVCAHVCVCEFHAFRRISLSVSNRYKYIQTFLQQICVGNDKSDHNLKKKLFVGSIVFVARLLSVISAISSSDSPEIGVTACLWS